MYGKIWYDENEQMFGKRGMLAKVIYMLNLGTIPDEVAIDVFDTKKKWIGSIEEEFLTKLKQGDIFALGGKLYQFEYAKEHELLRHRCAEQAPRPYRHGISEQLPLSYELASEIGEFRARFSGMLKKYMKQQEG